MATFNLLTGQVMIQSQPLATSGNNIDSVKSRFAAPTFVIGAKLTFILQTFLLFLNHTVYFSSSSTTLCFANTQLLVAYRVQHPVILDQLSVFSNNFFVNSWLSNRVGYCLFRWVHFCYSLFALFYKMETAYTKNFITSVTICFRIIRRDKQSVRYTLPLYWYTQWGNVNVLSWQGAKDIRVTRISPHRSEVHW